MNVPARHIAPSSITERVNALPWPALIERLESDGFAATGTILSTDECAALVRCYDDAGSFRKRVVMASHGFGRGEYQYFRYPLEPLVGELRAAVYPQLAPAANRWAERLKRDTLFPPHLDALLARCHAVGQARPTPLLLRYGAGDYNCLHADLYGEFVFPFQLALLLNEPGRDFDGGEFVLVETRPRMQSRAYVVPLSAGAGVLFAVNARPVAGNRGDYRVTLRHGVSPVRTGSRMTLGIIFHDAA